MKHSRRTHLWMLLAGGAVRSAQATDFAAWSDEQKEAFLKSAAVTATSDIGHGVTKPIRAEMALGEILHSAQIQSVDKELSDFFGPDGSRPVPMRDSWRFNVAAYKLDRLLQLRMAAVAVPRTFAGKPCAFSWWVDDVMFEEVDRIKNDVAPPDAESFDRQRCVSRVFDELIINIDRNLSNLLITKSWKLALIDHSRCFTPYRGIRNQENLSRCSRGLLTQMKALTTLSVSRAVGKHLTPMEVSALLARRDRIVKYFEGEVAAKGDANVVFS